MEKVGRKEKVEEKRWRRVGCSLLTYWNPFSETESLREQEVDFTVIIRDPTNAASGRTLS